MRFFAFLAAVLAVTATSGQAQDGAQFRTKGFGLESCGSYVQALEEQSNALLGYRSWMNGYVSGVNAAREDAYDLAGPIELDGLMQIAGAYCDANNEQPFVAAAAAVLGTLDPLALETAPETVEAGNGDDAVTIPQETLRDAQRLLKEGGHYGGPIDGLYGPGTRSAFRSFQEEAGVPATGVPDQRTLVALVTRS